MKKGFIIIIYLLWGQPWAADAQVADTSFDPGADTTFLHRINKDPTGYISGNEGIGIPKQGFYTLLGQTQPYNLTGMLDNFAVALPLRKYHTGLVVIVGEGSNKANATAYCQNEANVSVGAGTVSGANVTYYTEIYQMLGLFGTIPYKRFSADVRCLFAHCSWTSPDGSYNFTPMGTNAPVDEFISGIKTISWGICPGIGFRYIVFERLAVILNGDVFYGFKNNHIEQYNITGGLAYEL